MTALLADPFPHDASDHRTATPVRHATPVRRRSAERHRPPLRVLVRPAPLREPPFDDEVDAGTAASRWDQQLPFGTAVRGTDRRPAIRRSPALPDPCRWGRLLLIGLIESADGRRPLQQLAAMLSLQVHHGLRGDFERAAELGSRHWLRHATVLSIRGCEPADGVAEICATVGTGNRVRAVALRLERQHGRWRCTRLQLG